MPHEQFVQCTQKPIVFVLHHIEKQCREMFWTLNGNFLNLEEVKHKKNGGIGVHQEVNCSKITRSLSQSDCVRMEEHFFRSSIVDCF